MEKYFPSNSSTYEGYVVEIDGNFKSEYGTFAAALKAGFELRKTFPHGQVKVRDANEQPPTDAQSEVKTVATLN